MNNLRVKVWDKIDKCIYSVRSIDYLANGKINNIRVVKPYRIAVDDVEFDFPIRKPENFILLHGCLLNRKEYYEEDIIRIRRPYRSTQTHYGDNIPNGEYTEPLEPEIDEQLCIVKFKNGIFGVDIKDGNSRENFFPIEWYTEEYTEEDIKREINSDYWDEEDGDLCYLLSEYNRKNTKELINYLKIKVVGNTFQNKDLFKGDK